MIKLVCNNCGKSGHQFHQCKLPITSYGIVAFRPSTEGIKFLMIRRKDTFGYIDFMRGKYSPYNVDQVIKIVDEMSIDEKKLILVSTFSDLWKNMWGDALRTQYRGEETASNKKFDIITNGVEYNGKTVTIRDIIEGSTTQWPETEWEFPKGRRNYQERDLDCALREFEEETGISNEHLKMVDNLLPFDELFIGSNHKSYKHRYFLAYLEDASDKEMLTKFQKTEVSKLEWKTYDVCLESMRPYNLEKKEVLRKINSLLEEYRLYS